MDETDILIIKELAVDPRMPYRDLAERLSLSVNGAHKRIQQLIAKGIIQGFRTRLTPFLTGGSVIALYGRSLSTDLSETMERIGANDCTSRIIATGGQFLYVDGLVRTNEEIHTYQSFVRDVGKIDDLKSLAAVHCRRAPVQGPVEQTRLSDRPSSRIRLQATPPRGRGRAGLDLENREAKIGRHGVRPDDRLQHGPRPLFIW